MNTSANTASTGILYACNVPQTPPNDSYCSYFVNHRFAVWQIGSDEEPLESISEMLEVDQQMLQKLPVRPFARLFLPVADPQVVLKTIDEQTYECFWVEASADSAIGKHPLYNVPLCSNSYFVFSFFRPPTSNGVSSPRTSTLPGAIGTRVLFSNDYINLWDFQVHSMETCDLHEHLYPYLFIKRTAEEMAGFDENMQPTKKAKFHPGEFRFMEVDPSAQRRVHAAQNISPTTSQEYIIEFKL